MHNYLDERSYWDSPLLLSGPKRQLFFYRGAEQEWRWQENSGAGWSEREELPRNKGCLCGIIDLQGRAHLVIFEEGALYYLTLDENRFSEKLLQRENNRSCSHLLMAGDAKNTLHLLYLALDSHNSRWWLFHHRFTAGGWEEPRIIDFGGGNGLNYGDIAMDHKNNLHLVYRKIEHEKVSLYYRHFNHIAQHWSKALPLASGTEISYPSIAVDRSQNIHTVWAAADQSGHRLTYRVMVHGGWPAGGWKPATFISPPLESKVFPFFDQQQELLTMSWLNQSSISSFRYKQNSWEKLKPLRVEKPMLVRHCLTMPPGITSPFWNLTRDGSPLPYSAYATENAGVLSENLGPQFNRLIDASEALVHHASSIYSEKSHLRHILDDKRKELNRVSQQNRINMQDMQRSLEEKDKELQLLENNFKQTVAELKEKVEQTKINREKEKLSRQELQSYKKERRQFDLILKEKENTIAGLLQRLKEQEQLIKQLNTEKEALTEEMSGKAWGLRKILGKFTHNKP